MEWYYIVFLSVTAFIMLSYAILGVISNISMQRYIKRNSNIDYHPILSYHKAVEVSLIAPAFNESKSIIDNVRSLLNLNYTHYEILIINDGSTDDTLEKLINAFELNKQAAEYFPEGLSTQEVNGIYTSTNQSFRRLTVIDKVNGGKSDAMNVGINYSSSPYFICIDVDCIIDTNAILKLVKPFIDTTEKRVIATGGVVRIANSCEVEYGKIKSVKIPRTWLARSQVLEYLRAFLLGRMAWAHMDGLLLISGAFGMFDKQLVIKVGGYDVNTVGEDVELVVRMRRYCVNQGINYTVKFIPDPLCYTEVPETLSLFFKQRSRWTRGLLETLWKHRKMAFNPKYGMLGMIAFPYWIFFEYLAPIIEFFGIIFTLYLFATGQVSTEFFLLLFGIGYLYGIGFSLSAILADDGGYQQYKGLKTTLKLIVITFIDPLIFHPLTVIATIRGNILKLFGVKSWGNMNRTGFLQSKS